MGGGTLSGKEPSAQGGGAHKDRVADTGKARGPTGQTKDERGLGMDPSELDKEAGLWRSMEVDQLF